MPPTSARRRPTRSTACAGSWARRSSGRGRVLDQLLVHAPRHRRQAGAEPLRRARRGRGAVPAAGKAGRASCSPRRASSAPTRTSTSVQPRIGRPFTWPLFAAPGQRAPHAAQDPRGAHRARRERLAAGHAAAAHHAVHARRRLQPQRRRGVRRAAQGEPRGAHRRLPRSRVARARGRGSGQRRR